MICQLWDSSKAKSLGLFSNKNSSFYSWDGCVFFSASVIDGYISCHVASTKYGKRKLRIAIKMFCQYMNQTYPWYRGIIANISNDRKSVKNLVEKCGFKKMLTLKDSEVYLCHLTQ